MKEKKIKGSTLQWIVMTAMLLMVIVAMFVEFYSTNNEQAQTQVNKNFTSVTEGYASTLHERLIGIQKSGKTIVTIMEQHSVTEQKLAEETLEALHMHTDAYMAIMIGTDGKGVNQDGEQVSLAEMPYYEQIKDGKEQFLFLDNDGISDRKAVLSVLPIYTTKNDEKVVGGSLLLYFPIDEFGNMIRESEFDGNAFYLLTDSEGNLLESYEGSSVVLNSTGLMDLLSSANARNRVKTKMQSNGTGVIDGVDSNVSYRLIYVPVRINDWYIVIGIKSDYAKMLQNQSWDNAKDMFIKMAVIVIIFLGALVVMTIVSRIHSNEKKKDLEDKADTDLLTDLNNKLATERKIKEYIAGHPNEQALIFVLDIDNFKKINDTMGHAFGDEVLRTLGQQIRGEFRVSDIIGRTGGDEFMIFLKNIKDDTILRQEAKRVAQFFSNFQAGEYVKYSVNASIGAAVYPRDAKDFEGLYKAADKALYKAKERGKNQLAFYGDDK